jgi:putative salt-induced outer membrane protein
MPSSSLRFNKYSFEAQDGFQFEVRHRSTSLRQEGKDFSTMKASSLILISLAHFTALLLGFSSFAQEIPNNKFTDESELALVSVSGNSSSNNVSAKQSNSYTFGKNTVKASGHYLRTQSSGVETARSWDLMGRYERVLYDSLSAYTGYGADSDPYAGYVQRDNYDIGLKYDLIHSTAQNWWVEAGYRYSKILTTVEENYTNFGRTYMEYNLTLDNTYSIRYWIEYLPNFTDPEAYFINTEPSFSIQLTKILSLKASYLIQYHNELIKAGEVRTDTTFTTSLVAKF